MAAMGYRIPREAEIVKAIENVLVRNPHVRSQSELTRLVSDELFFMDQDYKVSGNRIRKVGIRNKLFRLDIRYARSNGRNTSGEMSRVRLRTGIHKEPDSRRRYRRAY